MRHIIPISGKDSLATAIVQLQRAPGLPYEFMFNPTGAELPDIFEWLAKVEVFLGKKIVRVGEDLDAIIQDYNYWLPSHNKRYCTKYSKIKPMERWLGKDKATVYYGIRSDEDRGGYENASGRITPVMPLQEESIDIGGVYEILAKHDLKPPVFFWKSLCDEVCLILGGGNIESGWQLICKLLKPWQIDFLFAWRSRANCYFCFNQAIYEWIGLLEHYPDLFWKAESYEHLGGDKIYTWQILPLAHIAKYAKGYKRKRIRKLVKMLRQMSQGKIVFDDTEEGFNDMLKSTSCGLFCGK